MSETLRETIALAIETTRATIERDIPAEQRGMVVASSLALADAVLAIPEIADGERLRQLELEDAAENRRLGAGNLGHSISTNPPR